MSTSSVSTDPVSTDPYVGKRLPDATFNVDQRMLQSYHAGLGLQPRADGTVPSTIVSRPDNDYIAPSAYEAGFLSLAHDEAAIDETIAAWEEALATSRA